MGNDILDSFNFAFAPKGLRLKAQGCRFGYLGTEAREFFNRNAVASVREDFRGRNRDAVVILWVAFFPRVAEAATLGFEA